VATPVIPGQRFNKEDIPDPTLIQNEKKFEEIKKKYRTIIGT
jgi:hypothetical protein